MAFPRIDRTWRRFLIAIPTATLFVVGGVVAHDLFAPKPTTTVHQQIDTGTAQALSSGTFQGADRAHKASGTVTLYEDEEGTFLFFEDYQATSGPDVYFFLSTSSIGDYNGGEVVKVLVPGGAEGGQATLRGDFRVPVPDDVDATQYRSVIAWCEDFSVEFGHARLS